jgi:hypothetical protein
MVVSARVGTARAYPDPVHALPPRVALVPNAIAFRDPAHGVLGGGWIGCENGRFGCSPHGTVQLTSDGGKTWRVVLRTTVPVVQVGYEGKGLRIVLADGANRVSADGARSWRPAPPLPQPFSPCPPQWSHLYWNGNWVLCTGELGAGAGGKAVYHLTGGRWQRLAYTPFPPPGRSHGGLSVMGYALGIAMAPDGFGLIWESRGTLYVTRDGGSTWVGLPKVAVPEVDFGLSAMALPHGVGFAVLAHGGTMQRRLVETTDAGRTWRVVHRWR